MAAAAAMTACYWILKRDERCLASWLEQVGVLIKRYEDEHISDLTSDAGS
jgi:hypothetical protein